jgi:ketosteroid isomerase-like protein
VSRENVELVRGLFPAEVDYVDFVRDDDVWAASSQALASSFQPDFEIVRPGAPGGKTYTGLEGARALWLDWLAPWATYRGKLGEMIDCGDRVLVFIQVLGRLEGSELEVENSTGSVWTIREGKVARVELYDSRTETLKAAGLE